MIQRLASGLTYSTTLGAPSLDFANENVIRTDQVLGQLAVDFAEFPSASLNVKVAPGGFESAAGVRRFFAGAASFGVAASATNSLWLEDDGTLAKGTAGFPSDRAIARLAVVVAGPSAITSITSAREPFRSFGAGAGSYLPLGGGTVTGDVTLAAGADFIFATTGAGTMIGTAADQKIGFHGVAPTPMAAGADQGALTDSTGAILSGATLDATAAYAPVAITGVTPLTNYPSLTPPSRLAGSAGGSADGAVATIPGLSATGTVADLRDEINANLIPIIRDNAAEFLQKLNDLADWIESAYETIGTMTSVDSQLELDSRKVNVNIAKVARLANALRAAMAAKGLIKGSS